ncbi:ArsC family reductase [Marinomonas sp. 15G1-11]|uniref:ArsC family reductase n=1 Tax=Marinomonas phaeophyticola TaxID=3004091 RepID=A0ABT4JTZ8_9GAMM|nr:ArsC family reductase [Marinomonas sp. 15G1-11]MCZ2721695.1 ArsC family reductase [Marinomonas sp. 15G1-11]
MVQIYGIKNCDTMKKTFKWLNESNIQYQFNDYKKNALTPELINEWVEKLGWESLVNKRGTTWRKLDEAQKNAMSDTLAKTVLLESPSMIKRPLMVKENDIILGFTAENYHKIFS